MPRFFVIGVHYYREAGEMVWREAIVFERRCFCSLFLPSVATVCVCRALCAFTPATNPCISSFLYHLRWLQKSKCALRTRDGEAIGTALRLATKLRWARKPQLMCNPLVVCYAIRMMALMQLLFATIFGLSFARTCSKKNFLDGNGNTFH